MKKNRRMNLDRIRKFLKIINIVPIIIIIILLIQFFTRIPNPNSNVYLVEFSLDSETNEFRTGYPITFKWEILGFAPQAVVNWTHGKLKYYIQKLVKDGMIKNSTKTVNGRTQKRYYGKNIKEFINWEEWDK